VATALGARTTTRTTRVCRSVTAHVVVARPGAPLVGRVVHAHTTRTVRVRVCRRVRVVVPRAPAHPTAVGVHRVSAVAQITTATLATVHLTVPVTHTHAPPLSLGVALAVSPFDQMRELASYTAMVGQAPRALMWYRQWNEPLVAGGELQATAQRGITPIITWEPYDPANPTDPRYGLAQIAAGAWDRYITQSAQAAQATGVPMLINLAPEMNGAWEPWGPGPAANSPAAFVAAYRHVVEIFRGVGATNVGWIWAPNTDPNAQAVYGSYYPGDGYVDWVGLDGYNFGTTSPDGWLTPAQLFGRSYLALVGLTTKPVIIAETASSELGGDKAAWINQLAQTIPSAFPRVRAVVWFQRNKETDWRVNSSPTALAAFQGLAANPAWAGPAPPVHPGG